MNTKHLLDVWAQAGCGEVGECSSKKKHSDRINSAICNKKVNTLSRAFDFIFLVFLPIRSADMFQHSLLVSITHEWKNVLSIETNINFIQKLDFSNGFFDFMAPEGRSKDYVEGLERNCNVIFVSIRIWKLRWRVIKHLKDFVSADVECLRWGERPSVT